VSVAGSFRRTIEDVSENLADIVIVIIGIVIIYAIMPLLGGLWGGIQSLLQGMAGGVGAGTTPAGQAAATGGGLPTITGTGPSELITYPSGAQLQTYVLGKGVLGQQLVTPPQYPKVSQYFLPSGPGIAQYPSVISQPFQAAAGPAVSYITPQWGAAPPAIQGDGGIYAQPTHVTIVGKGIGPAAGTY